MNGFALGLGLKRRLRATRKWAILAQSNDLLLRETGVTVSKNFLSKIVYLICIDARFEA